MIDSVLIGRVRRHVFKREGALLLNDGGNPHTKCDWLAICVCTVATEETRCPQRRDTDFNRHISP